MTLFRHVVGDREVVGPLMEDRPVRSPVRLPWWGRTSDFSRCFSLQPIVSPGWVQILDVDCQDE